MIRMSVPDFASPSAVGAPLPIPSPSYPVDVYERLFSPVRVRADMGSGELLGCGIYGLDFFPGKVGGGGLANAAFPHFPAPLMQERKKLLFRTSGDPSDKTGTKSRSHHPVRKHILCHCCSSTFAMTVTSFQFFFAFDFDSSKQIWQMVFFRNAGTAVVKEKEIPSVFSSPSSSFSREAFPLRSLSLSFPILEPSGATKQPPTMHKIAFERRARAIFPQTDPSLCRDSQHLSVSGIYCMRRGKSMCARFFPRRNGLTACSQSTDWHWLPPYTPTSNPSESTTAEECTVNVSFPPKGRVTFPRPKFSCQNNYIPQ